MAQEIERKFLVLNDSYKEKATNITYVSSGPEPETPEAGGGISDLDPVNDTWD